MIVEAPMGVLELAPPLGADFRNCRIPHDESFAMQN